MRKRGSKIILLTNVNPATKLLLCSCIGRHDRLRRYERRTWCQIDWLINVIDFFFFWSEMWLINVWEKRVVMDVAREWGGSRAIWGGKGEGERNRILVAGAKLLYQTLVGKRQAPMVRGSTGVVVYSCVRGKPWYGGENP